MKSGESQENACNQLNQIKGVLWGAVLGDVIGAYLEFNRAIDQNKVKEAFLVKGGGMHKLETGQPTDDSELAFAVGKGLVRGKGKLDLNLVAEEMGNWFLSKPIDVGGTIRNSVPKACNMKVHQAHLCRKGARENSETSQSNGTLMAISTLAIWCHRLSAQNITKAVRQYTILIHPNQLVVLCNTFYVLVLTYLLNNRKEDNKKQQNLRRTAFQYAKESIDKYVPQSTGKKQFSHWIIFIQDSLSNAKLLQEHLPAVKKSGWVRIAFSYAIYQLLNSNQFKQSLANILRLKGDTDTNACIAGALMGSYFGYSNIEAQLGKQMQIINQWRPKVVKRPQWLVPGLVIDKMCNNLFKVSPTELNVIGSEAQYK